MRIENLEKRAKFSYFLNKLAKILTIFFKKGKQRITSFINLSIKEEENMFNINKKLKSISKNI